MRMWRKTVLSEEIGCQRTGLRIVNEIEVRDLIAPTDVMLGQVAAPNKMHTKQIDEKQLPIERKTIVRVLPISCFLHAEIVAIVTVREIVIAISINPTVVGAKNQ
jgi:hypothetical protein